MNSTKKHRFMNSSKNKLISNKDKLNKLCLNSKPKFSWNSDIEWSVWYMCLKTENCSLKTFVKICVGEKVH